MSTQSEILSLEIIHENNDFIVVNKQAGHISEKSPYEEITTESLLLKHLLVSKRKPYIGVIHRLDRVTSGVLLFAKKKNILVAFNQLFSERKIQKTYLAIVSFVESSFFPIPPDVMIVPMVIAKKNDYLKIFLIATIFSTLGGFLGYFIGIYFSDVATHVIEFYGYENKVDKLKNEAGVI